MRQYAPKLASLGIEYDRYRELLHFCRQYDRLSDEYRRMIDSAAQKSAGQYAALLLKNICCRDIPYRYLDIPYSESQYKRIRRSFFMYLNELKKAREN